MTGGGVEPGRRSPAGKPLQTGKGSGTRPAFAWLPHPGISNRRSSENDPLREEGAKRSQKGKTRPGGKRRKIRGRPSGEPGPCSRKKSPSIPMERRSFRSNRPFAAIRSAERPGKRSPLPIKPSFRGNAYIFSRFRKNTGRCGRCAPFSVSVFASAFPRRISG